ncbi:MAG: type II secretion system protein [Spirochaetaceae bacterium]|nr:type II secretion system protein [Spirochaetaceae bacterium]
MLNITKNEAGFTLLEIILSLVILSIIVAIAGLGIVTGTKGYLFARQNAHSAQKAQMALARMTREFQELYNITDCSDSSVTFESSTGNFTIGLSENTNTIRIATGGIGQLAAGDILIDEIAANGFTLTFFKDNETSWAQDDDIESLTDISIEIKMIRNDISDGNLSFSTSVHPRNVGYW